MAERFDKEAVYDEQIFPLMGEIIAICQKHEIPMVASFFLREDDEEGEENLYCTSALTAYPHAPRNLKRAVLALQAPEVLAFAITVTKAEPKP